MFVDVIVLECDIQDALLTRLRLRRVAGMRCRVRHVTRLDDLARAIEYCDPALIIMDVLLPEVWGAMALSRVQAMASWVPVIVMTAFDPPGLSEAFAQLQPAAVLDKSTAGYAALPGHVARIVQAGHLGHERVRPWPLSA